MLHCFVNTGKFRDIVDRAVSETILALHSDISQIVFASVTGRYNGWRL